MKGVVHCIKCGAIEHRDPARSRGTFVTAQDQIDFTNAELRTLVYKANPRYRGKIKDEDVLLIKRARNHQKRAQKGVKQLDGSVKKFKNCVERWDRDERYRQQLEEDEKLTREDMMLYDDLAALPKQVHAMPWEERQERMRYHAWDVVQAQGGGSQTVPTTQYPTYRQTLEAKASAQPPAKKPSKTSSSWWSSSWQDPTPPWKKEDKWWEKKW